MSDTRHQSHVADSPDGDAGFSTVTVDVDRPIDLYVENPNGDTVVRVSDRGDVLVRWHKHGRPDTGWYDEANVHVSHEDDNRIGVKVSLPPFWPGGDFGRSVLKFLEGGLKGANPFGSLPGGRAGFDLAIELPRQGSAAESGRVRVRTANGDVTVVEVVGALDVATANGEVTTSRTSGEVSIHAANGNLRLERPTGRVTARTVSGDLEIAGGNLSRFTVTTVNGDARIETALTGDASRIESVNGDIRLDLTLPAATGGSLSIRSVSGSAKVESPFRAVAKRTWRIGPGADDGPSVAIKTVSGDLYARGTLSEDLGRRETPVTPRPTWKPDDPTIPLPPPAPEPPKAATTQSADARLTILQAVERGELDIEEAMRRLDALGKSD